MTAPTSATTAAGEAILATLGKKGVMSPGALAKACGYRSTTALRHHMTPLLMAGRVVERGKSAALRFSLPVTTETVAPRPPSPARTITAKDSSYLETVWDGSKGSPSLTGGVAGMGSSLSGTQYEVGRRLR